MTNDDIGFEKESITRCYALKRKIRLLVGMFKGYGIARKP
jgi:hypothetical protein